MLLFLPLTTNVAYESDVNCFCINVTTHLYIPWCCGNTLLIVRVLSTLLLDVCSREPLWYQAKDKSPNPVAEQMNCRLLNTLPVVMLGAIETAGDDTKQKNIKV